MFAADLSAPVWAVEVHDPVAPAAYSTWVPIVGGALLVLIGAWLWWVFWHTRERPFDSKEGRGDRFSGLRQRTLADIAQAEERYREGATDLRTLHLDLNHIMREFANGRLRMDTSSLTVGEIARIEGTDRLSSLLTEYEEPAFAVDSDAEALAATTNAKAVVEQW
ncbi:hypothetical protein [Pseudactinotalea sp.]|uniref:hypothetical protein n=1 Tax=Pseudactinotalea sp. TaxID=1926260 RepID=UPI003B3B61A6